MRNEAGLIRGSTRAPQSRLSGSRSRVGHGASARPGTGWAVHGSGWRVHAGWERCPVRPPAQLEAEVPPRPPQGSPPWRWRCSAWWSPRRAGFSSTAWTSVASAWRTRGPSSPSSLKIPSCSREPSRECGARGQPGRGAAPGRALEARPACPVSWRPLLQLLGPSRPPGPPRRGGLEDRTGPR